jgi:hypothetical protein
MLNPLGGGMGKQVVVGATIVRHRCFPLILSFCQINPLSLTEGTASIDVVGT